MLKDTAVIILAAGMGSRLRPITNNTPKCLTQVGTRPILGWQLSAIAEEGIENITVVAGYRSAQVRAYCEQFGSHIRCIDNRDYATTNNMYSLCLALSDSPFQRTLIINGDIIFRAHTLARVIAEHSSAIAAKRDDYNEESMKISVNDSGQVSAISKGISAAKAWGISIDLYSFESDSLAKLKGVCSKYIDKGRVDLWSEVAINDLLSIAPVYPIDIGTDDWVEVDTFEDLAQAKRLFCD